MRRSLFFALCLLLGLVCRSQAQGSPQFSADSARQAASVDGLIVKSVGNVPLKKVLVQLIAEDPKSGSNRTATTESDGHFHIDNVDAGRYHLFLEKTGYLSVNARGRRAEGYALSVQPGQTIEDLYFQMLPMAVFTGRVVDEDGEPMGGVAVFVQKRNPGKGGKREMAGAERTNDLGEYRVYGLFPGQYFLVAVPPPDARDYDDEHDKGRDSEKKDDTRYLTTYYPGTNDGTQASPITLRAGDEMPINVTLFPARTYRVRGILTGSAGAGQKPVVELISKAGDAIRPGNVRPDGQFEITGVAPGSYVAKAFSGPESEGEIGRGEVTVVAADVEGVRLAPVRPFTLSGHLRFEGQQFKDLSEFSVYLQPKGGPDGLGLVMDISGGKSSPVDRNGKFEWTNVTPGTYVVNLTGVDNSGHFLKSVMVGNSNSDTGFTVTGPASVELVVSSKGAMIEGAVLDNDKPAPNVAVVAVPEEKYRDLHDRVGVGSTDQSGHFLIKGLAPGSYTVFAWQDVESGLYYDEDFLKAQEASGAAVKVEEGAQQRMELKLSAVSEDWQ